MKKLALFLLLAICALANALTLPDEVAWYPLHDGDGNEAKEAFDRLPPAKITGSFWMSRDGLNLIDFGGMKNSRQAQVDLPPVEINGEFSIAIWVSAYWWNENWDAICVKNDATYGVKNNQNHRPNHVQGEGQERKARCESFQRNRS